MGAPRSIYKYMFIYTICLSCSLNRLSVQVSKRKLSGFAMILRAQKLLIICSCSHHIDTLSIHIHNVQCANPELRCRVAVLYLPFSEAVVCFLLNLFYVLCKICVVESLSKLTIIKCICLFLFAL